MNEILPVAVIVGVVSGLITAIPTVFISKSNNKLQHITSERAKWREEIRGIASKLQTEENIFKIEDILCELKVKINTYGIANQDNVFQDAHIWKIIGTLENPQGSSVAERENKIKKAKKILIEYLSCLLKHDWERSKGEVIGNYTIMFDAIVNVLFFVGVIFCCNVLFKIDINCIDINQFNDMTFVFSVILAGWLAVMNFIIFYTQIKMIDISKEFIKSMKDKKKFWGIKSFIPYIIYTILWIIYLCLTLLISNLYEKRFQEKALFTINGFILLITYTMIYILILYCIYQLKASNEKKIYIDYYNTINKIYEMEICPNDCDRRSCPK